MDIRRKILLAESLDDNIEIVINCFVAMEFNDNTDKIYFEGIQQTADRIPGYKLHFIRADREPYSFQIIGQNVVNSIQHCEILVADISPTEKIPSDSPTKVPNPSVMHEIGFALGSKIPVVLIGNKESHKSSPANLRGSILIDYDLSNIDKFIGELSKQLKKIIEDQLQSDIRGDYQIHCFTKRDSIGINDLIKKSQERVQIITTNLEYVDTFLKSSIKEALEANKSNLQYKVEILTMDPEADTTNARAEQLGKKPRNYRDELRQSLDSMQNDFLRESKVEIVTYKSLPTQITFIIDNTIITSAISFGQQARNNLHFVMNAEKERAAESFLSHFRSIKALSVRQ